jgi:hypothetical protein
MSFPTPKIEDREIAALRRRGYRSASQDGSAGWVNERLEIALTFEAGPGGGRWVARTQNRKTLESAPTVDILLTRILPHERALSVDEEALHAVTEVAERVLQNERGAISRMSVGEFIAATLIFDWPRLPNYSILGAIERLGYAWFDAALVVRRRLIADGKIDPK